MKPHAEIQGSLIVLWPGSGGRDELYFTLEEAEEIANQVLSLCQDLRGKSPLEVEEPDGSGSLRG